MKTQRSFRTVMVHATLLGLACLASGDALATSGVLSAFNARYPGSTTSTSAGCNTCHGGSTSTFNAYGRDLAATAAATTALRLAAIEAIDSDKQGHSNLVEITSNTQPGWCAVAGCDNNGRSVPAGLTALDPTANQAPVANAGGPYTAAVGVAVSLNGSASRDPDGTIASYAWNFGNGSSGSGATPSVTYASAGTFTITLTVTDNAGATNQAQAQVSVTANTRPPVANAGGPYSGTANVAISFSGAASTDPDGSIVSYSWTFGDGSAAVAGATPVHTYAAGGSYTVVLTVTDNDGLSNSASVTVNVTDGTGLQPPVARPGGPYTGLVGQALSFNGAGSSDPDGSIVSYDWKFGDGGTASGATPTYAYATAGTYTVELKVTDSSAKTSTATTTATIAASNRAPTANPGGPYTSSPGVAVAFDGRGSSDPDGTVASYAWDFGDGSGLGSGATPSHAYTAAGTYTVTLRVTDNSGLQGAAVATSVVVQALSGGEALYAANCRACHGDPWSGPAVDTTLPGLKRVAGSRSCTISGAITGTSVFPQGVPDMVAYGNRQLSSEQIGSIADYLNSREATGEQRYVSACAGCHGNDGRGGRVSEGVRGSSAGKTREAIGDERKMQYLSCLPTSDLQAVGTFLGAKTSSGESGGGDGGGGGGSTGVLAVLGLALLGLWRSQGRRRLVRIETRRSR